MLVQALTEEPDAAVGRAAPSRAAGGLHRRQERGVCAGADAARRGRSRRWCGSKACPASFRSTISARCGSRYQDGTETKVHFFASRLKYSRWVEVTLVADERVETLVRALVDHLAAFGGIPLVAVFDRPKTVALKWGRDGVVTEWNPTFAGVALDLGHRRRSVLAVSPARERQRRESRRLGERLVLQAAAVSRSRGSRAAAARVAHRGEYRPAVARDGRAAGGAHRGGARAAAAAEDRAGRPGAADSGERQSDGRGDARRPSVLDAARRDWLAGHAVSLSRSRADRRRPLQCRA